MSKAQRVKGHQYERDCAQWFQQIGFVAAKRHLESQSAEAEKGIDLDNTGVFLVQCKKGKKLPDVYSILEQIKNQPTKYKLGMMKRDHKEDVVCMYREDFEEVLRACITEGIIKTT